VSNLILVTLSSVLKKQTYLLTYVVDPYTCVNVRRDPRMREFAHQMCLLC